MPYPHHIHISSTSHPHHIYISSTSHPHHIHISFTSHPHHIHISSTSHPHLIYITSTSSSCGGGVGANLTHLTQLLSHGIGSVIHLSLSKYNITISMSISLNQQFITKPLYTDIHTFLKMKKRTYPISFLILILHLYQII